MKKVVFVLFLFVVFAVSAQDTLSRPPDYCAVHYWPGDTLPLSWYDFHHREPVSAPFNYGEGYNTECNQVIEGTTLSKDYLIYGLSVGIYGLPDILNNYDVYTTPEWATLDHFIIDTGTVGLCEMIRIYDRRADSIYIAREAEWCYGVNPVSYYMHPKDDSELTTSTTYYDIYFSGHPFVPEFIPVYDIYFDSPFPYTAGDTLYMGITTKTWDMYDSRYCRIPMWVAGYGAFEGSSTQLFHTYTCNYFDSIDCIAGPYLFPSDFSYFINTIMFPIINSAPNSIDRPYNQRVTVNLTPNPAHNETRIETLSELLNIEIYSAAGHPVYSRRHSGHTATIDTRGWPAGVYIVNVLTSVGTGVEKFVIK